MVKALGLRLPAIPLTGNNLRKVVCTCTHVPLSSFTAPHTSTRITILRCLVVKGKCSPYLITKRRIPELIPVRGSQPVGDKSHKPGVTLPLLFARPAVTLATLNRAAPISLLDEQRHDGCAQFA